MKKLEGARFPHRLRNQSGCLTIAIPRPICRELGWTSGNYLAVRYEGDEVRITRMNLALDSQRADQHHRIPPGKHGNQQRKEAEAEELQNGEWSSGTKKPG